MYYSDYTVIHFKNVQSCYALVFIIYTASSSISSVTEPNSFSTQEQMPFLILLSNKHISTCVRLAVEWAAVVIPLNHII